MGDTRKSFDLRVLGEGHPIYSCDSMLTVVKVAWDFAADVMTDELLNVYQGIVVTFLSPLYNLNESVVYERIRQSPARVSS